MADCADGGRGAESDRGGAMNEKRNVGMTPGLRRGSARLSEKHEPSTRVTRDNEQAWR